MCALRDHLCEMEARLKVRVLTHLRFCVINRLANAFNCVNIHARNTDYLGNGTYHTHRMRALSFCSSIAEASTIADDALRWVHPHAGCFAPSTKSRDKSSLANQLRQEMWKLFSIVQKLASNNRILNNLLLQNHSNE